MCLKNINTDILFFSGADVSFEDDRLLNLYDVSKDYPSVCVRLVNDTNLSISKIEFMLSVIATERTGKEGNVHDEGDTPENTFFFNEKYRICLRITEPSTGCFIDLDTIDLPVEDNCITLCRKIFSKKFLCKYQNVSVAVPPEGKDLCVLKVLIQHVSNDNESADWVVQSIHPIRMIMDDNEQV